MKKISEIFNPRKITISGKSKIVDTDEGRFVIKKKSKDIKSLYDYLHSRSFTSYPELLDELIKYSYENKRKFDRVAAFGIVLLADEDMIGKTAKK